MDRGRLCIDIDNVLAQTDEVMRELIRRYSSMMVDLEYEDVVHFDYRKCTDKSGRRLLHDGVVDEWQRVHEEFSREENILRLKPVEGTQACLEKLMENGFRLHFVTSRLPCARAATVKWLELQKFPPHRLHFVGHREKHLALGSFAVAVEDDLEQAEAFVGMGVAAYLIAHPWNEISETSRVVRVRD